MISTQLVPPLRQFGIRAVLRRESDERSEIYHVLFTERSLVTVWSAPNYCYRCGNVASILCFDENLEREVKYFTETEENSTTMAPRSNVSYFL